MVMVFTDELFDAQWLRAAGHSSSGGADIGECFAAARAIGQAPDAERWFRAWLDVADRVLAEADTSLARGRNVSARSAYLRASNYYRAAYTFLIGAPVDPRVVSTYRRQRAAFEAALSLMTPAGERIRIPYGGGALHGYLFCVADDGRPRPTLIINGGYDSTAEEAYFFSGAAALARGYSCIVFDGPGQGAAIIEDGLVFRPDWEAVIAPVVDFVLTRGEVEPSKIALMGISFGGYLAPRAASGEHRLAACIADPGELSLFDEMKSRMPPRIARELPRGNPLVLGLLSLMLGRRLRHVTAGWGLRRGLWVHGVKSPLAYLRLTEGYTLEGRAERIRCPTLVCSAEDDDIGVTADRLYESLTCEKTRLVFTAKEGAGAHCEAGARMLFNQRAFDWLDGVLANATPARGQ
ncbi:MAG: alpha/beta fold hydrolase [Rhizomicrobium sp.]|jgi:pimeloyl-ACP methyl ester carboxylesterase